MADGSFKEFVLDQLSALPALRAKAMFGAHGLYCGDKFFGILDEGRLFFKTDERSRADFIARGMGPFTYEMKGKLMTMAYHEVPPDVLEQPQELTGVGAAGHATAPWQRPTAKRSRANFCDAGDRRRASMAA